MTIITINIGYEKVEFDAEYKHSQYLVAESGQVVTVDFDLNIKVFIFKSEGYYPITFTREFFFENDFITLESVKADYPRVSVYNPYKSMILTESMEPKDVEIIKKAIDKKNRLTRGNTRKL